jgi:hypothetical protein
MIVESIKTKIKDGINAFGFCPTNEITIVKRSRKAPSKARYRMAVVENWVASCDHVDHLAGATAIQEMLEPAR